jgi:PAS domain S-box-containing protein
MSDIVEKQLQDYLDSSGEAIISLDENGNIIVFSKQAEEIFGYQAGAVLGKSIDLLLPSRFHDIQQAYINEVSANDEERRTMENAKALTGLKQGGDEFPIEVRFLRLECNEGEVLTATVRDLTEEKRLQEEHRKLYHAVQQSASTVLITDIEGTIEFVNPRFTSLTGYEADEVIGKNPSILSSGETPPEVYNEMWNKITLGGEWRGELLNKRKDGELYWSGLTVSAIKNEEGEITHYLGIEEDISRYKDAEVRLEKALAEKAELEKRLRALEQ